MLWSVKGGQAGYYEQGGFRWSSQHLDGEELRWQREGVDELVGLYVLRCGPRGDQRWHDASIGSSSGGAIARGLSSEAAAVEVGVSPAVGTRWFREAGGMPPVSLAPESGRYSSFAEREELAILHAHGDRVRGIAGNAIEAFAAEGRLFARF